MVFIFGNFFFEKENITIKYMRINWKIFGTLILIGILAILIPLLKKYEAFTNYLSVYDGDKSYMNFIDYIHSFYNYPYYYNRGYVLSDLRGQPHLINQYSDPYLVNPNMIHHHGMYFNMPHNRKIIRI